MQTTERCTYENCIENKIHFTEIHSLFSRQLIKLWWIDNRNSTICRRSLFFFFGFICTDYKVQNERERWLNATKVFNSFTSMGELVLLTPLYFLATDLCIDSFGFLWFASILSKLCPNISSYRRCSACQMFRIRQLNVTIFNWVC